MGDSDVDQVLDEYDDGERQLQRRHNIGLQNASEHTQERIRERRARRERNKQRQLQERAQYQEVLREFPQDSDSEDSDSDPNPDPNPDSNLRSDLREMVQEMIQEKENQYRARETERDRVLQFRIQHLESEIQNLRSGYKIQIQKLHAQLQEFIQKYQLKYTVCKT